LHTAQRHNLQYLEHTERSIYRAPDNGSLSADTATVKAADRRAKFCHVLLHVDCSCSQQACEIFHFIFFCSNFQSHGSCGWEFCSKTSAVCSTVQQNIQNNGEFLTHRFSAGQNKTRTMWFVVWGTIYIKLEWHQPQ
jgi:hypothetical protein